MNKHTKYILSEILDDCGYVFKPCVGYEGILEISRDGIIRKINGKHKVIKSTKILSNGYEQMEIKLYDHNYHRYFNLCEYVHRLVAKTFIKNKNPKKNFVNHKDGNKINNNVKNLEWVDRSENAIHYYKVIKPKEDHT